MAKRRRPPANRHYPRTARLNTLLQEIIADHLELIDDDRLGFLTVTGVEVDADLNRAIVYISAFADESYDDETLEALDEHRPAIQRSIASQTRLRKTPRVEFRFDPAVRTGARIEDILATLQPDGDPADRAEVPTAGDPDNGADE